MPSEFHFDEGVDKIGHFRVTTTVDSKTYYIEFVHLDEVFCIEIIWNLINWSAMFCTRTQQFTVLKCCKIKYTLYCVRCRKLMLKWLWGLLRGLTRLLALERKGRSRYDHNCRHEYNNNWAVMSITHPSAVTIDPNHLTIFYLQYLWDEWIEEKGL